MADFIPPPPSSGRDAVLTLAQYVFRLGRETEAAFQESKRLITHAYDRGYQAGRADVEKELGLDECAVLVKPPPTVGGTGAANAPN